MKIITGITNQAKQTLTITLADGSSVAMSLEYRPQQLGWFANFQLGSWVVLGLRLTASPNILSKWQLLVPFGIAILTRNNVEPLNANDFVNGTATVYLLDQADIQSVNALSFNGG